MTAVWDFIQNEVLGMHWLNRLIGLLLNSVGLSVNTRIGASVQFFIYDIIKIMVLLGFLILIISYIQSYFPPERTKRYSADFTVSVQTSWRHCSARLHHSALARQYRCLSASQVQGCPSVLRSRSSFLHQWSISAALFC